ncbi:MAG: hypothetical protein K1X38_07310 [Microthrixaceae bacterium]|nr:hypothetical protein [Microthrixaceae bacterium]
MSFDIQQPAIPTPTRTPTLPGLLSVVDWVGSPLDAQRSISGAKYQPGVTNPTLREWVDEGTKVSTSSPAFRNAVVTTPYLRRKFSGGEGTYAELRDKTIADFEDGLEGYVVRRLISTATVVDISPGGDCPLVAAVGLLERALWATNGQRRGYVVASPLVSPRFTAYTENDYVLPSGNRLVYSAGAISAAELTTLDEQPADVTLYACAQPFGHKSYGVTSEQTGDDFDFDLNDVYVTVEGTVALAFDSTVQLFACTTSSV